MFRFQPLALLAPVCAGLALQPLAARGAPAVLAVLNTGPGASAPAPGKLSDERDQTEPPVAARDACLPPRADELGIRVLTEGGEPALSPDGAMVAFVREGRVCVMELKNRSVRTILEQDNPHVPCWSPDGRRIAFQAGSPFAIWIVGADGTGLHRFIEPDARGDQHPLWSPDGRSLVWTHGAHLWIADTTGANARPLTPDSKAFYEMACDWSPDGATILYSSSDTPSSDSVSLRLVGREGTGSRPDATGARAGYAQWSRDGRAIYFEEGGAIIRMEHVAGGAKTRFPRGDSLDGIRLALAPDGSFLLHDCLVEGDEGEDELLQVTLR